ncbi:transposase [Legionella saoudiensis]|uniref:transposase n=1 Tax=Legionella saoudiensis TaxID=1750561 RepID=UPI000ACD5433|nr:transposase [Legionella saoudiensis]
MVRGTSGFFKAPVENAQNQGKEYEYINVGGEQFHAVAVALIDYLQNNLPINDAAIKKILSRFYQYFPQHVTNDAYLTTPKERMSRLLSNSRKSELVECMAYVLRQLTVDKLFEDHLNLIYRDVFANLPPDTAKSYLRDMKTVLPPSCFKGFRG